MIQLTQMEADHIIAHVPNRKLIKASERKNHGGKTYYVLNDDYDSFKTLAMLRGYSPINTLVVGENGKPKEKIISATEQLYRDNWEA